MTSKRKFNSVSYQAANRGAPPLRGCSQCLVERIVSGGQTGVDRAALDFAIAHGIPHGGWCPRGRLAEDGALDGCYTLRETPEAEYPQRTNWNVRDSDGTLIVTVARELTGGSALTRELANAHGKPCLHLSQMTDGDAAPARLREFIRHHGIKVLNVAGPRCSSEPAAGDFAAHVLEAMWTGGDVRGQENGTVGRVCRDCLKTRNRGQRALEITIKTLSPKIKTRHIEIVEVGFLAIWSWLSFETISTDAPYRPCEISGLGSCGWRLRWIGPPAKRKIFRRLDVTAANECAPSHPRLRIIIVFLAGDGWDANENLAVRTLNLASGQLLVALQWLITVRAGEFEFWHKLAMAED